MQRCCVLLLIVASVIGLGHSLVLAGGKLTLKSFGLTPVLKKHTKVFHSITDDKLRYQQLLYLATTCPPMNKKYKIPENKVPGCQSTVFVHAERKDDGRIFFEADADSQMAKGLVTLLVEGLTDNFPCDIEKVDPAFIDYAGIGSSLTAGRNNGFLNMLAVMKLQARKLDVEPAPPKAQAEETESKITQPAKRGKAATKAAKATKGCTAVTPSTEESAKAEKAEEVVEIAAVAESTTPMHRSILTKLQTLQPTTLRVENVSAQHKNHTGKGQSASRETNFNVFIVAACFEKMSLIDRHKMVYALLQDELANGLHALSIVAKTAGEV